jgi:hypothetical protein
MIEDPDVCTKCGGNCCKYTLHKLTAEQRTPRNKEFFDAKSVDLKIIGTNYFYVLNQLCPHYTESGCDMGIKDRPKYCQDFPPRLDDEWVHFCPLMRKIYK